MSTTPTTTSLVDLAARRQLPHHQYMDPATVEWIKANRPDLGAAWTSPLRPASKHLLGRSALPASWLAEPRLQDSLHGVRHSMRTATLAALLAEIHGLDDADTATVVLAAAVHDCQRLHDKDDRGHGARAAIWLAANADTVWTHFGTVATPRRIIQAATAIRLHDLPYDAFCSDDRADYARAELICDLVKAADALDRYRLPKLSWWPDVRHVREPAFDQLRAVAFDLVAVSETAHLAGASSAEAVRFALAEKGLV
ncbi:HD domain-containing protein [Kitasatospora sp. NPDC048296]|uniref:HD domain-containing protein n=1 Tax=Kitasatospora sp. NPDC048296 TaxID=3364048 RepID=UPI00371EAB59